MLMRTKIFMLLLLIASVPFMATAKGKKIAKIVLDAGHGGKDVGARGAISMEKDITLAVTLKLGKIFSDSMKDVQILYTRTTDAYPSLVERHEIANHANADLFIAVHVNSTPYTYTKVLEGYRTVKRHHKNVRQPIYRSIRHHETKRSGVETYVLALRRNYQKEKSIGEYSDNVTNESGLLDESDPQTAIIIAQYAQTFLSKSVSLGSKIQEQFAVQGRPDLGVKQLPLEVLAGSVMPGVLVEIGFITNIEEEAYLNSERGQQEVAMAIYKGIRSYKADIEK
jgi:N-acetylmuramoyl-L-alanine amidase